MFLIAACCVCFFGVATGVEPRFNEQSKNLTVVSGNTAILPCSVDFLGNYSVVWLDHRGKVLTLNERRIMSDERISVERPYTKDWNLFVRSVRPTDAGTYMCQVNTNPVKVQHITLHVHEPAKIIDHLSSNEYVVAKEGDTVELVCNVTGQPHPTVTWHRIPTGLMHDNDQREEKQIGVEGEVLVIHNVTRYCDDLYKCVAYNNVKPAAHRDIRVYVEFPPEIRLPNRKLGQSKGKTTILECIVTAYPHAFNVWRRHGKDITRNSKYNIEVYDEDDNTLTLSLRIQSLTEEDYGKYECVSENPLGRDSETMILCEYPKYDPTTTTTTRRIMPPWPGGYNVPTQWPHSGDNNALPNNEGKSWPDPRFPDAENPDNIARPNVEGGENSQWSEGNGYTYNSGQRSPSVIVEPNSKANQLMWNSGCVLLIATSLTAVLIGR